MKQAIHLIAEPGLRSTVAAVDAERPHKLRERLPQDQHTASGPHRFGAHPGQQQARQVAVGELVTTARDHVEREGAVDALVLFPVAGVGAGQGAQRHRAAHETEIGGRLAGRDKLVHLIGEGEMVLRRARGYERLDRAGQIGQGGGDGNQAVSFVSYALFSHAGSRASVALPSRLEDNPSFG